MGNKRRVLVSDMSGKSNVEYKAREMGLDLGSNGKNSSQIVSEIKSLEDQGYQFDVADGSMKILLEKFTDQFQPLFDLESFRISIEKDKDQPCSSHATIKIKVGDTHEITAAEGNGPVSALDNALRKALGEFYPDLDTMSLVDFKVRVIDGREGTAARVRVLIESRDSEDIWTTVGVSEDIIEASWQAPGRQLPVHAGQVKGKNINTDTQRGYPMSSNTIKIFDTTLRDGEQSPGASMNTAEKLRLAIQLEKLGVDIIEAGFPGGFRRRLRCRLPNCRPPGAHRNRRPVQGQQRRHRPRLERRQECRQTAHSHLYCHLRHSPEIQAQHEPR